LLEWVSQISEDEIQAKLDSVGVLSIVEQTSKNLRKIILLFF
jgi:hypothetical protein